MKRNGAGLKRALVSCAAAVALLTGLSGGAWAQTAPATSPGVETIIVTAQQREENLQDVPISVAAVPADKLATMFVAGEDVVALATRVPGLYAESSNARAAPRFYIRGLGNTDFDLAASQPVSVIMDDVVMENVTLKATPLFDLGQVEVYRGPQGTLFGRNTTAGILRFTSKKPTEEFSADVATSYGTFNTFTLDGGVGGAIIPGVLSARASLLYQHRDDWIDNMTTPGDNDMGGFDELAGRVQLLYTPTDKLDVLLNVHGRDLEGTAAIFRANAITTGTNGLGVNYDRDKVAYDGGAGNPQEYKGWGANAKIDYDFDFATLTSITAYETTEGFSRGDIDGGVAGVGPGFIPFSSDTQDSMDDLKQVTQEVRLASTGDGALSWQGGVYYFDGSFEITTQGPGFPPVTTVEHENTSWAVFGQASFAVTDNFKFTGGLRYTEDEKDFGVLRYDFATGPLSDFARSAKDEHVSWEVSGIYDVTDDFSVYARLADGFRGPSIQGRDVAFGAPPSVAGSETIQSFEAGWKSTVLGDMLRLNGAAYVYSVRDLQLTAVGGAGNTVQLLNADKGKAAGFELDAEFAPVENLVLTGGFSYTKTEIDDENLAVGVCAQCTILDPTVSLSGSTRALIDGNPFPNAPEFIADFTARYAFPLSSGGEIFVFTDWAYQGKTSLFLYDSVEFKTNAQHEGGLKVGYYNPDFHNIEAALFVRNITNADNIKGGIDFNNNTVFVNDPRVVGASLRASY